MTRTLRIPVFPATVIWAPLLSYFHMNSGIGSNGKRAGRVLRVTENAIRQELRFRPLPTMRERGQAVLQKGQMPGLARDLHDQFSVRPKKYCELSRSGVD